MPIRFRCSVCQQFLGISHRRAGQIVECPSCGRNVRVPERDGVGQAVDEEPAMNLDDSELVGALEKLADIGAVPESSGSETIAPSAAQIDESNEPLVIPPPQAVRVEQPPLADAKPIAEAVENVVSKAPRSAVSIVENIPPADASPAAVAAPANRGASSGSWSVAAIVGLIGAAIGYAVGTSQSTEREPMGPETAAQPTIAEKGLQHGGAEVTKERRPPVANRSPSIRGTVKWVNAAGAERPDAGARVLVFPESRPSSFKLRIEGFRCGDADADCEAAGATLKALGGCASIVADDGSYSATLNQPGTYTILMISRYQARDDSDPLPHEVRVMLDEWFDGGARVLGKLSFAASTLEFDGRSTAVRDHSFDRPVML